MKRRRLLAVLGAGLLGLLALLPDARAEESCASILARAEYPQGRDITATVPMTFVTPGKLGLTGGAIANLSVHAISLQNAIRIPDDAPGPITLAFRLTHDLPMENHHFKTDMPGVGLLVEQGNYDHFGTPFTLGPGQSLRDVRFWDLYFALSQISDDLAPGLLDLSRLPGVKLECAEEQAAPAWVVRLGGSLNIQSATCEVQPLDQVVDLGEHPASSLMREGDTTPWVDFGLRFSNCQPFYGTLGTSHGFNGEMLKQSKTPNAIQVSVQGAVSSWAGDDGHAAGVRLDDAKSSSWWLDPLLIQLQMQGWDRPGQPWWDSGWSVYPDNSNTEYSMPMRARYYRNSEAPLEPGQKNASAVLMIKYL